MISPFARSMGRQGACGLQSTTSSPTPQCHQSFCLYFSIQDRCQKSLADSTKLRYAHIVSENKSSRCARDVRILFPHPLRGRRSSRLPDGRISPVSNQFLSHFLSTGKHAFYRSQFRDCSHSRHSSPRIGHCVGHLVCDGHVDDIFASLRSRLCHRHWCL